MKANELIQSLQRWGNYNTAFSQDEKLQIVNEELRINAELHEIVLRSIDRRTHIEVVEMRRGHRVAGKFIPGNIHIDNYDHDDKAWRIKALVSVLKDSKDAIEVLTHIVKALYEDENGRIFLNKLSEILKQSNDLEGLSRIVTARMMMNAT